MKGDVDVVIKCSASNWCNENFHNKRKQQFDKNVWYSFRSNPILTFFIPKLWNVKFCIDEFSNQNKIELITLPESVPINSFLFFPLYGYFQMNTHFQDSISIKYFPKLFDFQPTRHAGGLSFPKIKFSLAKCVCVFRIWLMAEKP